MSKIIKLSPHVADLIAAGEVVERPASVVKELLENAVDAGANIITVEIKNGGMSYIRVTDNGAGMTREDAKVAFQRHATSKISAAEDLAKIETLGFRGEALAAISAVSRIELLTKTADQTGTSLTLEGGESMQIAETGCPEGTTLIVRNLFYNTPARLKFLKKDSSETAYVKAVLEQAALANPRVSLKFIKEGETVMHTPGDGELQSVIYSVFGRQLAKEMLFVNLEHQGVAVCGFVSSPLYMRGNRQMQHFSVNGRPVKSKIMFAALEQAYANRMMKGRFPACILDVRLEPSLVDVNVHPAKTEVKFAFEKTIFQAIYNAAGHALSNDGGKSEIAAQTLETPNPRQETPASKPEVQKPAYSYMDAPPAKQNTAQKQSPGQDFARFLQGMNQPPAPSHTLKSDDEILGYNKQSQVSQMGIEAYKELVKTAQTPLPVPQPVAAEPPVAVQAGEKHPENKNPLAQADEKYRIIGQAFGTYIVVEQEEQVLFIDKHAAHERIIFNKLLEMEAQPYGQMLIMPIALNLSATETDIIMENKQLFAGLGFDIDIFGINAITVRQIPIWLEEYQVEAVLGEAADMIAAGKQVELREGVAHTIACKAAIKAGKNSQDLEVSAIVESVLGQNDLKYCPHGRPITAFVSRASLEKQVKRKI